MLFLLLLDGSKFGYITITRLAFHGHLIHVSVALSIVNDNGNNQVHQ
jgi:hypothetical protein